MIDIRFKDGGAPKMFRRLLELATPRLAARLGISDYNVKLTVWLMREPEELEGGFGYGMITPDLKLEEGRISNGLSPRAFHMVICYEQSPVGVMETISHEFVHLKQWLAGELRVWTDGGEKKLAYLGNLNAGSIPYKEQPWEKEALRLQGPLAEWLAEALLTDLDKEEESLAA